MSETKDEINTENKPKKADKVKICIIILLCIMTASLLGACGLYIKTLIDNSKKKSTYNEIINTIIESYLETDTEKYEKVCYPNDLLQSEADVDYGGDKEKLRSKLREELESQKEKMEAEYGDEIEFKVKITSINQGSNTDYTYVKNQMSTWTKSLKRENAEVENVDRVKFSLDLKGTQKGETIDDCTAVIMKADKYGYILWDWSFEQQE